MDIDNSSNGRKRKSASEALKKMKQENRTNFSRKRESSIREDVSHSSIKEDTSCTSYSQPRNYSPEIERKVKFIIMDKLGVDSRDVYPSATFKKDLGADSLDAIGLIMEFETEFNVTISDDEVENIRTVGDAIKYIETHVDNPVAHQEDKHSEKVKKTSDKTATASKSTVSNVEDTTEDAVSTEDIISNKGMFKRPFSFKGRIRRLEYGLSYIILCAYSFLFAAFDGNEGVSIILSILAYWFIWAQGSKRCHDRGNSGWYQLIPFYVLWMLFGKGEEGANYYGDDPKE